MTTAPQDRTAPAGAGGEQHEPDPTLFGLVAQEVAGLITERLRGRIAAVQGLRVTAVGLPVPVGARCAIRTRRDGVMQAEVVGLQNDRAILSVLGEATGARSQLSSLVSTPHSSRR